MEFKTNIMCGACIAKVTPALNALAGEGHWKTDTQNPAKILTIENTEVTEQQVIDTLEKVGYKAERLA